MTFTNNTCPCGSELLYCECCQPLLTGAVKAKTAEALMRSRYCGYVKGNSEYLLNTWHHSTRPHSIDTELTPAWCNLQILRAEQGSKKDSTGLVEFKASAISDNRMITLHELSHFIKENDRWYYVNGDQHQPDPSTAEIKIGRNAPCPCGSGKKYKKCCKS